VTIGEYLTTLQRIVVTYFQGQAVHCLTLITKAIYASEHR